jgi:hypothetical protein
MARGTLTTPLVACLIYLVCQSWSLAMDKITIEQARAIASENLNEDHSSEIVLVPGKERQYPFGWVFFGAPKKFLETGDLKYEVPGLGPLAVEFDGSVHPLTTSGSPDSVVAAYLQSWRARQERRNTP